MYGEGQGSRSGSRSESERYGSRGSQHASDPWQSSRGYEQYGLGGMGQYSGQYSREYDDRPWSTELGTGAYGSEERTFRGTGPEAEMTDYGRERVMQGAMHTPRVLSEETGIESREGRMASQPAELSQRGQRGTEIQPSWSQQEEMARDMGTEQQCYIDYSSGYVDLDPACGLYGRHPYGAQMGYGRGVFQSGEYRKESLPSWPARVRGYEPERRYEHAQAPSEPYGAGGMARRDIAQPSYGQQPEEQSFGRRMQEELTPTGREIAIGGMPLYFQDMRESRWREMAQEEQMQRQRIRARVREIQREQAPQQYMLPSPEQQYLPPYQRGMEEREQPGQRSVEEIWGAIPGQGMPEQYQPQLQRGMEAEYQQQPRGPYSQAVARIPYGQPGMSMMGETFGPYAFSRGSYYGPLGLQQYGGPVQHENIPEPTSPWRGGSEMGMRSQEGTGSLGGLEQGQAQYQQYQPSQQYQQQYQPSEQYQQQYQPPEQYQPSIQEQYESESSRGKSQYGMGREQFSRWPGEPCMMGTGTGSYSCSQFVTERYGGGTSAGQLSSGTEPMSRMAGSEMAPYGHEMTREGAIPLYKQEEEIAGRMQQRDVSDYGEARPMGLEAQGEWQASRDIYPSQEQPGEMGRYAQRGSESGIYPGEMAAARGISGGAGQRRPGQAVSEYSGITPTPGPIGPTYEPVQRGAHYETGSREPYPPQGGYREQFTSHGCEMMQSGAAPIEFYQYGAGECEMESPYQGRYEPQRRSR